MTSGPKSYYVAKHWTRAWLLVAAGAGSDSQVMDWAGSTTMGELQAYLPDMRDHTGLVDAMRLGDVQELFGFSSLWLAWLCCCIGYAKDNHAALTAASDAELELACSSTGERPAASDAMHVDWWPADPVSMGQLLAAVAACCGGFQPAFHEQRRLTASVSFRPRGRCTLSHCIIERDSS